MCNFRILVVMMAVVFGFATACSDENEQASSDRPAKAAKAAKKVAPKRSTRPRAKATSKPKIKARPGSAWFGIKHQTADDEAAEDAGLTTARGAVVLGVADGGPADRAGIREGDVLVAVAGIAVKDSEGLIAQFKKATAGRTVKVTLWRDGNKKILPVRTIPRPGG